SFIDGRESRLHLPEEISQLRLTIAAFLNNPIELTHSCHRFGPPRCSLVFRELNQIAVSLLVARLALSGEIRRGLRLAEIVTGCAIDVSHGPGLVFNSNERRYFSLRQ